MSVLLQTIMFLLIAALVMEQPAATNTLPADGLANPATPGSDQLLPPGLPGSGLIPPVGGLFPPGPPDGGLIPPGDGLIPPGDGLLPPGLIPPGDGLLPAGLIPPGDDFLHPGDALLPLGGGLLPPGIPGEGSVPPPIPGDGLFIPTFIPGFGGIDLHKRKCAGKCSLECMKPKRNRLAAKICTTLCMIRCGIRRSNVVYSCTQNCANSRPLDSISDDWKAQILLNSCFESCKMI